LAKPKKTAKNIVKSLINTPNMNKIAGLNPLYKAILNEATKVVPVISESPKPKTIPLKTTSNIT
jgi:hypothetical protein